MRLDATDFNALFDLDVAVDDQRGRAYVNVVPTALFQELEFAPVS
jgi:hypothetical protein